MKKKLAYGFSILFGCIVGIGLFLFAISGDNSNSLNEKLLGKWRIVGSFDQGIFEYHFDEFVVFKEETAIYCKVDECYEDNYKVNGNEIKFLNHNYHISSKIDEYLKFYTSDDTYMILLRWNDENIIDDQVVIEGNWNVIYKDTYINDMKLEFKDGSLNQITSDQTNSYQYEIKDNYILIDHGKLSFICIPISEKEIVFVDTIYGTVWGLNK